MTQRSPRMRDARPTGQGEREDDGRTTVWILDLTAGSASAIPLSLIFRLKEGICRDPVSRMRSRFSIT